MSDDLPVTNLTLRWRFTQMVMRHRKSWDVTIEAVAI